MSVNNWDGILSNTRNLNDVLTILRKVLAQLSNKFDVTELDEIITKLEGTNDLVLDDLEDLKSALNSINEQGGWYKPYLTEVLLLADRPNVSFLVGKALDTKKTFAWERTSAEGVTPITGIWHDTGLSELDQAKEHTNQEVELAKELTLEKSKNYTDTEVLELEQAQNLIITELAKHIAKMLFQSSDGLLFNFSDSEDNSVLQITKDGEIRIVGLPVSLQQYFKERELIVNQSINQDLLQCIDADGNIFMKINKNGQAYFVGLEGDIVSEINSRSSYKEDLDLLKLVDHEESFYLRIDKDSKLFIVGLDTDVATAINSKSSAGLETKDTSNLSNYSYRDTFIAKADKLLNFFRNTQDVGLLAPVPLNTFAQNFSISDTWLNEAKISEWGDFIPVTTPYGNNRGVVHPQILEFPNLFMEHRYIVAITGYTSGNTKEENPFLLGSNDLANFKLLTPLLDEPDSYTWEKGTVYNSDPFMFYDVKTSELVLMFRMYCADTDGIAPNESREVLYTRRTKDGKTWSDREILNDKFALLSPAVIFDAEADTYHLYGVGTGAIEHYTSKTAKNDWVHVGTIVAPVSDRPWHIDIKQVGDKQIITYHDRIWTPTSQNRGFRLGIASDFHTFKWADEFWNTPEYGVYKATFLPQFNEQNEMRLVYVWTTDSSPSSSALWYRLFVQPTPYMNVNFQEK